MSNDPYEVLGVGRNATIREIQEAYYKLKWYYDCWKQLDALDKDKEDKFNNVTKAYHELLFDEHHLILSGYPITLAINDEDHRAYPVVNAANNKQLTEEEIEEMFRKSDIAFQKLQNQEEKETEKKLQKPILALQEIREQEEYETIEKQLRKLDILSAPPSIIEHRELMMQRVERLRGEIKLMKKNLKFLKKILKSSDTEEELSAQKNELLQKLNKLMPHSKKLPILITAVVTSAIVDSTMLAMFAMNLVNLEVMLSSTIAFTVASLACSSFAACYCRQTPVSKLLNDAGGLDVENLKQGQKVSPP
ncbi:MAG: Chaperone protein DnaJ [Wolbachia endosymbiont of Ctenocephalides felis wCfeF]|nr:MAG: Chaperone protein DnaJ [Wolbachia endosymbiont of Ctenocephalides felis wCfeF]